ncbi:hypothetical protein DTW90_29820 [Neorhizobium sp. P12A]|nr:hypothetical protein DTW90_29820 [Neorhizobium sp. P12A]
MLKSLAVLIPITLWFSSALADGATLLITTSGLKSSVIGSVSGSRTSRYNLNVVSGQTGSIELSSDLPGACSLRIVELPRGLPLFEASGPQSTYKIVQAAERTLQIVAYPSRDAYLKDIPCSYTINYDVD